MTGRTKCRPYIGPAFDVDVHDCPCGHMYGDHDYRHIDRRMEIISCLNCKASAPDVLKIYQCGTCKKCFSTEQGRGLHWAWAKKNKNKTCKHRGEP